MLPFYAEGDRLVEDEILPLFPLFIWGPRSWPRENPLNKSPLPT
jgi:hypothetical protein